MRSMEYGRGFSHGTTHDSTGINFEFQRTNSLKRTPPPPQYRTALGKPTPSKWDDAQKWLVGLSRSSGERNNHSKPRNSNADDRRLIAPVPQNDYPSSEDEGKGDTRKIDHGDQTSWQTNDLPPHSASAAAVRSIQVRDMGTEMTPIASLDPSRSATPIRATTPEARSPIASVPEVPARSQQGTQASEGYHHRRPNTHGGYSSNATSIGAEGMMNLNQVKKLSPLEIKAMAWDEAVRAKNMARYKREEIKIQTWENHEKRKAEMEMKRMEVKAERLKARAQEKLANRLAATKRIAEERRANAEAMLNDRAMRTSERADYIKKTGHLPPSCSFKLPSICWH